MKVLFLTPWYPNRKDAMSGLFVQKHAQAVARQGIEVYVLYICVDGTIDKEQIIEEENNGVKETILYTRGRGNLMGELLSIKKAWKYWYSKYRLPNIVHLNVITKLGLLAIYLQKRYNVPYLITEHWSGYLPENGDYKGIFRKNLTKFIAKYAKVIMPVSEKLKQAMQKRGIAHNNYKIIHNVIDDFFYLPKLEKDKCGKFRFLHVSCFDNRAKNTVGIVKSAVKLFQKRSDFEIIMVGTGSDIEETKNIANKYGLEKTGTIKFVGEQKPEDVKKWMDESDCFVLFSNYETAAVVLEEAAACGLPIITTPVGIAEQIVDESVGKLVKIGDEEMLSAAMNDMIEQKAQYDKEIIKHKGRKYSFDIIGKQIKEIYAKYGK